jgi:hypothetical protein
MVSGDAWDGETPAAWIRPQTSPNAAAFCASASTDARDDTSTVAVLTVKPALSSVFAAASALPVLRSASSTCLPAPTRRAMA